MGRLNAAVAVLQSAAAKDVRHSTDSACRLARRASAQQQRSDLRGRIESTVRIALRIGRDHVSAAQCRAAAIVRSVQAERFERCASELDSTRQLLQSAQSQLEQLSTGAKVCTPLALFAPCGP